MINSSSFDIRAGTIVQVTETASSGSYLLKVNFGSIIGLRTCILRKTPNISTASLLEKHVCAIINFPEYKKNVKTINTLLLCMSDTHGYDIPIQPDYYIANGGSLFS